MNDSTARIVEECKRQEDSCKYSAATLFEWLKALRFARLVFVVLPIIAGAFAAFPLLRDSVMWVASVCALIAGVSPAIYKALDFDVSLESVAQHAAQFKNLQDRFRQAANITAAADVAELEQAFSALMDRMDALRATAPVAPEKYFKRAQKKVKAGDYDFDVDGRPPTPPAR